MHVINMNLHFFANYNMLTCLVCCSFAVGDNLYVGQYVYKTVAQQNDMTWHDTLWHTEDNMLFLPTTIL